LYYVTIIWLICAAVSVVSEIMDLDYIQYVMEFGVTWAYSIVPSAVNIFIALSNEAYSAKM